MIRFHAPNDIPKPFICGSMAAMTTIHIARLGKPIRQWEAWIRALADAGLEIKAVDALSMEQHTVHASPDDVILYGGMLPNLSRFIQRTG